MQNIDVTRSKIAWKNITKKEGSPTEIAMQALMFQLESHRIAYYVEGIVVNSQTKLQMRHTWIEAGNMIIDPLGYANWPQSLATNKYSSSFKISHRELNRYTFNDNQPLYQQYKSLGDKMALAERNLAH